jgi:hypothetical protein
MQAFRKSDTQPLAYHIISRCKADQKYNILNFPAELSRSGNVRTHQRGKIQRLAQDSVLLNIARRTLSQDLIDHSDHRSNRNISRGRELRDLTT